MDMEYMKFIMNNHVTDQHIKSMTNTLIFVGTLQKSFTQFHSSNSAPSHLPFYIILIYNSAMPIITYEDLQSSLPANLFNPNRIFLFTSYKLTLILLMWRIWRAPNNANKWQIGFNLAFIGLNCYGTLRAILCIKAFICGLCNTFTLQISDLEVLLSISGMSYHVIWWKGTVSEKPLASIF